MTYFKLHCRTCGEDFKPLRSDTRGELLYPEYDDAANARANRNMEALEHFHRTHGDHELEEIEEFIEG